MERNAEVGDAGTRRHSDTAKKNIDLLSRRVSTSLRLRVPFLRRPVMVWLLTATLTLAFVSLIVVAPVALAHGHDSSAFVLYEMFRRVCHQIPERAFDIEGHPFAVCARCTGIYFGFAAGVLLYPLMRSLGRGDAPARVWLLLALLPALLDFSLGVFRLWENTHLSRSLTGALLGAVGAFYVVPGLMDLSRMGFRQSSVQFEGVLRDE